MIHVLQLIMKFAIVLVFTFISFNPYPTLSAIRADRITPTIDVPAELLFGAGTSAVQVEGALKTHGRGESIAESTLLQAFEVPESDADFAVISSDSYHRYKEDVEVLKYVGVQIYRFSMSWTRLLPNGYANRINKEGVDYYHALLDELEQAGIEPMVQLHHFDDPAAFNKFGGWQNETMIWLFKDYARFVFREYGHRVKYFLTFNEPNVFCNLLESGLLPLSARHKPKKPTFPKTFICSSNILKAHAEVYHLYHDEFNLDGAGKISINLLCNGYMVQEAKYQHLEDVAFALGCGWFADPIYSKVGDYSDILKQRVKETNLLRGYKGLLQLPTFSEIWMRKIRGSADFFGLSYYSSSIIEDIPTGNLEKSLNFLFPSEARLAISTVATWLLAPNQTPIVPIGLRTTLKKLKDRYNNPAVHIIENGYADDGRLDDKDRITFIYAHVRQVIAAMTHDQCNVKSYIYWSLIDNFEFLGGASSHFGLAHIDFNDPNRTRVPKESANWLKNVIQEKKLYIEE